MSATTTWKEAPLPDNETARLNELRSYDILDTPSEEAFDRITKLASHYFSVPIALVSFIDDNRQWFKSRCGIDATETPRDIAFCSHAILQDDVFIVRNTLEDERFADNPLVQRSPEIRFYAGAPLFSRNGMKLGTLCIIDRKPRPDFSDEHAKILQSMAEIVADELELRSAVLNIRHDLETIQHTTKQLEEAQQRTEDITREKSQFIASISHELRTPMNGILGMAYLLRDTPLDDTQKEYIETINHSAQNLLLLINDVLDLSKIQAKELILEQVPFDINNNFVQTIKLLKPLAGKKGIDLTWAVDNSAPEVITGDPGRFGQIITNLVGNAIKFTERGSVHATLKYDAVKQSIYCTVKDSGIGIAESKRDVIFEKFVQGDAAITRKYGGTGLGLAITKQLVVMFGGDIGFESEEGMGTTFWFTIPAQAHVTSIINQPTKPLAQSVQVTKAVASARVLIAEDHPVNQLFIVKLLKKFGFIHIDVAENGIEAMQYVLEAGKSRKIPYDAIIMDIKMPEQDGYETTRKIRDYEAECGLFLPMPIIAITANAFAADRDQCFAVGMDAYLSKPAQPDQLRKTLEQWFSFELKSNATVGTSKPNEGPLVDWTRVEMIANTLEDQSKVMRLFFDTAEDYLAALECARRSQENQKWKDALHTLRGSAANLGMQKLSKLCQKAESSVLFSYEEKSEYLEEIKSSLEAVRSYVINEHGIKL